MTYPIIVLCIPFAITIFLILRVAPIFGEIFQDFGGKLPPPTRFLIDVSAFVRASWYFLALREYVRASGVIIPEVALGGCDSRLGPPEQSGNHLT